MKDILFSKLSQQGMYYFYELNILNLFVNFRKYFKLFLTL